MAQHDAKNVRFTTTSLLELFQRMPITPYSIKEGSTNGTAAVKIDSLASVPTDAQPALGYKINGKIYNLAADASGSGLIDDEFDCSGLSNLADGEHQYVLFQLDDSGTASIKAGEVGTSPEHATMPLPDQDKCVVGYLHMTSDGTQNWAGEALTVHGTLYEGYPQSMFR